MPRITLMTLIIRAIEAGTDLFPAHRSITRPLQACDA